MYEFFKFQCLLMMLVFSAMSVWVASGVPGEEFSASLERVSGNGRAAKYLVFRGQAHAFSAAPRGHSDYLNVYWALRKGDSLTVRVDQHDVIAALSVNGKTFSTLDDYYRWQLDSSWLWLRLSLLFSAGFVVLWWSGPKVKRRSGVR